MEIRLIGMRLVTFLAIGLVGSGCAWRAVKPPTPADDLDPGILARLPAPPCERLYAMVFAYQRPMLNQPRYSHTWMTLVKGTWTPGQPEPAIEEQTISWLPTSGEIVPASLCVELGRNYTLHETLTLACQSGCRVSMWGPFEVRPGFGVRFGTQKAFLDSGRVGYQMIDTVGEAARTGRGCDCIHALTDMDPEWGRARYPLLFYGDSASANVVCRLVNSGVATNPSVTHDWLLSRLNVNCDQLCRRDYRSVCR